MDHPLEHLDVLRALRREPERLEGLEPAIRAVIQSAESDRRSTRWTSLLLSEDHRRVRSAAAELLQDVEDGR